MPDDTTRPLAGKVALVTGAARRVGQAIARELAAAGAALAVHHRQSAAEAQALAAELPDARAFQAELADPGDCARLVDEVVAWQGRLDLLVNNASVFRPLPFTGGADAEWEAAWQEAFAVNLLAPARLARRAAGPLLVTGGVIVNLLDVSVQQAWPTYAHYGAAKAGLAWLTRTLAVALAPVRCVGVAPGIAEFPPDLPEEARQRLIERVPLKRPGRPADIAGAVRYLATAGYVNGTVVTVDGGRLAASGEWSP